MDTEKVENKLESLNIELGNPRASYIDENAPLNEEVLRAKSSLKIKYDAQVEVIRDQIGSLETVRKELNLSQRQMAQLLMVDPSAWTRWMRAGEDAPPHIYRALQWYMALIDKIPGLTPHYFIQKDPKILSEIQRKIEAEKNHNDILTHMVHQSSQNFETEVLQLKSQIETLTNAQNRLKNLTLVMSGVAILVSLYHFLF